MKRSEKNTNRGLLGYTMNTRRCFQRAQNQTRKRRRSLFTSRTYVLNRVVTRCRFALYLRSGETTCFDPADRASDRKSAVEPSRTLHPQSKTRLDEGRSTCIARKPGGGGSLGLPWPFHQSGPPACSGPAALLLPPNAVEPSEEPPGRAPAAGSISDQTRWGPLNTVLTVAANLWRCQVALCGASKVKVGDVFVPHLGLLSSE